MEAGANPSSASRCPVSSGRFWGAAGEPARSSTSGDWGRCSGSGGSQAPPPQAVTTRTSQEAHASSTTRLPHPPTPGTRPRTPGVRPALLPPRLRPARAPPQPHRLLRSACQHAGHSGEHLPHGAQQTHAVAAAPRHSKGVVRASPSLLEAP